MAIATAWEDGVAGGERVGGFVADGDLDVAGAAGQPHVAVEAFDGFDAEPQLLPGFVADHDPHIAPVGDLPHAAAPGVEAQQRDPDRFVAQRFQPGQAQGLDGRPPVDLDGGGAVEQAGEGTGDQLAEGVAEQPGLVQEVPGRLVAACGDQVWGGVVQQLPQLRDGDFPQPGVAAGIAGEVLQRGLDHDLIGGSERHPPVAEALAADQPTDQGQPAAEHNRGPAPRFGRTEPVPADAEGPEGQRVDPGRQPGPDGERFHPERAAQLFVLILGVAQDQGTVAEVHHPQQQRLHRGGLAAAGFAEDKHVRVGDRHRVVEDPAQRVGVEAAAGQHVDADLGSGRRQAGGGDERPQHRRLV